MIMFCDKWSLLYLKTGGMVPYTYRRFMHFLYREDSPKPKYNSTLFSVKYFLS
jgi:hypothetical protein